MPGLVRKLLVVAAIDGLIIQPLHNRTAQTLKIDYNSHRIHSSDVRGNRGDSSSSLECHGIVGLLTISPKVYLIAISGRQHVADIRGAPIYVITDVAFIPTTNQEEAKQAILQARLNVKRADTDQEPLSSDSEISDGEEGLGSVHERKTAEIPVSPAGEAHNIPAQNSKPTPSTENIISSVAEDVIKRRGQYGRFTERWFSKNGWTADRRKSQGMSADGKPTTTPSPDSKEASHTDASDTQARSEPVVDSARVNADAGDSLNPSPIPSSVTSTLVPKVLRTSRLLLSSHSFFFSYDIDITRRLGTISAPSDGIPLHKAVDDLYFWNRHLALPFMESGEHGLVLPIMQGFVGQRAFETESKSSGSPTHDAESVLSEQEKQGSGSGTRSTPVKKGSFLITLISRRSTKRPGLRYVRRGVDDEGHTANMVETEQILSRNDWKGRVYSFTQIRGSIPLFFSQSPYAFKPVPVLHYSPARNQIAFDRHFKDMKQRYGGVQVVSLVDKSGGEASIGQSYEENMERFNKETSDRSVQLGFEWFDFHQICKGMKFENVSILMDSIGKTIQKFGNTAQEDGTVLWRQSGVVRTNCMDCLDRTNVVQSACGQHALETQLNEEGFSVDLRTDASTQWFNTLWADNGDAISKQYSSTAALKGDYTRTRKRDYRGAINDLGLTLSRYYNNIVNDYFSQATIDFLLGNVTDHVFEEFEDKLMSSDPGMSIQRVRENAITTCAKIVIGDGGEDMIAGWILLSPCRSDVLVALPMEEYVLLLTNLALYKVRYDWNDDKVVSFERVDLRSVVGLTKGVYITSTLTGAQIDEARNVGFVVTYRPGRENVVRVNTRSLSNALLVDGTPDSPADEPSISKQDPDKILAFKAPPALSSFPAGGQSSPVRSEIDIVNSVCEEIHRATLGVDTNISGLIQDKAIISLQEARKNTGLVDQLSHALKRFVWG